MSNSGVIASSIVTSIIAILSLYFNFSYQPGDLRNQLANLGILSTQGQGTNYNTQGSSTDYTGYKCPKTSSETSDPCGSVRNGVQTFGVIVPFKCKCPSDTKEAGIDNVTPGGPYRICECLNTK